MATIHFTLYDLTLQMPKVQMFRLTETRSLKVLETYIKQNIWTLGIHNVKLLRVK